MAHVGYWLPSNKGVIPLIPRKGHHEYRCIEMYVVLLSRRLWKGGIGNQNVTRAVLGAAQSGTTIFKMIASQSV